MTSSNAAAAAGWVKSQDPRSGRVFYANHLTRKTQWDPPSGWIEEDEEELPPPPLPEKKQDPNWEVMHDPATGRPFYVDHARQITTWTKPDALNTAPIPTSLTAAVSSSSLSFPFAPSTSSALQRVLSHQPSTSSSYTTKPDPSTSNLTHRSSFQEAAYYHSHTPVDVDFSDSLPNLEFKVKKVTDALRRDCPHCDVLFTIRNRRHHCRLCGDVFCDACSNHRVTLPLEGPEFEKAVRVCDFCFEDVDKGNFFSMRRYLTPLTLYEPGKMGPTESEEDAEDTSVATAKNVAAALSALTSDLDGMLQSSSGFEEKMTIPVNVLIPAIVKHLSLRSTSDRAVRAIASLLALGSIVNNMDFCHAIYLYGGQQAIDDILTLLERSGSDRKTLFIQEQAAQAIFYLTDSSMLTSLIPKQSQLRDELPNQDFGGVNSLDLPRAFRSMLDHSSASKNPNLQRWATACIGNLVVEDQRRTTIGSNDVAAAIATGQDRPDVTYESFLDQLVSTGGIMILCSLIGADDADTRAHAMGALGATLTATRAIDRSLGALYEMTGGQAGRQQEKDGDIVRAIVNGGGCGPSLSQLLLSADNGVAGMGLGFASSLVLPLLEDPRGTATLVENYDCTNDKDGLGASREAALAIATGSCLPALLSLMKDPETGGRMKRPLELKKRGMEALAAIIMAISEMGKASPHLMQKAVDAMTEEGVVPVILAVLESSSSQSLSSDTPSSRIRECAGMILAALAQCSGDAIAELKSCHAVSSMLAAMSDPCMAATSTLRGDGAPRCLGMLQTATVLLSMSWHNGESSSELVDTLLETIDAGTISTLSRILFDKMDWESQDKAVGAMKARDVACRMLCVIYGIAGMDEKGMGQNRLYEVVDSDAYSRKPPRNIMTGALAILQKSTMLARNALMGQLNYGPHYHAALMDLVESSLQCVGSMCGSTLIPGSEYLAKIGDLTPQENSFKVRKQEVCGVACDIIVMSQERGQSSLLPAMLVGGFGEGTLLASLRLSLAIAQNGSLEHHAKLAMSGILVPISDSLRNALSQGDIFKFSACLTLVRFCGPHVAAGEGNGLQSVREAIKVATSVLTIPVDPYMPMEELERHESIKAECISALEALSSNASLWSSISKDALPAIVTYLHSACDSGREDGKDTRCAALRAIMQIVQLPSHAVSAARVGLAEPLGKMVGQCATGTALADGDDEMPMLALEVLHVIATNEEARREARFLECGVIKAVCHALGNAATETPRKPTDSRADITFWGLEILHLFLSDLESAPGGIHMVLQSPVVSKLVAIVASEPLFIKAMCSTLLLRTQMKFVRSDEDADEGEMLEIARSYGPPFVLVQEHCLHYDTTHHAALALLFSLCVYACAIENNASDAFWNTLLLRNGKNAGIDQETAATMCAHYLHLLLDDIKGPFFPIDEKKSSDFLSITRPLVRYRLLEGLKDGLVHHTKDPYMISMLVAFEVPQMCLTIWQDPSLIDLAFDIIKIMVTSHEDDLLHIFVKSKSTLLSLFDMLNVDHTVDISSSQVGEIRRVIASILGSLAENGLLTQSVEKFSVKSSAVSALAAACLADEGNKEDEDGELEATSSTMSSRCMQCLVELCTVDEGEKKVMQLSSDESTAIALRLGTKICQMVTSRFIERARLQQYDVDDVDDVMEAPDVKMLCAIAQHPSGLQVIASIGGLHALSLIAAEGELSAIFALKHACKENPSILLDVDGHVSIMKLIVGSQHHDTHNVATMRKVEGAAFSVLADLSLSSKGRRAVTTKDEFEICTTRAIQLITSLVKVITPEDDIVVTSDQVKNQGMDGPGRVDNEDGTAEVEPQRHTLAIKTQAKGFVKGCSMTKVNPGLGCSELEVAALAFLTNIILVRECRERTLKDQEFLSAVLVLTSDSKTHVDLRSQTTTFLVKAVPFASTSESMESLSIFKLAIALNDALQLMSSNLLKSAVAEGLGRIFPDLPLVHQCPIVESLIPQWITLIRTFTVARIMGSEADREHGSLFAYHISHILMVAYNIDALRTVVAKKDVLVSMINLTQWRYDSAKSMLVDDDQLQWEAATSNSLQIVASVMCGTESSQLKLGVLPKTLMMTPLMIARPGKAPRKACDFSTALKRVIEAKKDAGSYMCAKRILETAIE